MRSLDHLRGYYVHAPRWVRRPAGALLSAIPPNLLYGSTFRRLQADIERSEWDAAFVEQRTRAQLAALFSMARRTRHYAEQMAAVSVDSPTLADLARLSILDKQKVRRSVDSMLAVPRSEMDEVMTSGTSSGVALSFYLDKDRSVKEWAFLIHLWRRCGYQHRDRRAVIGYRSIEHLRKVSSQPWEWEPGTRELRLSPFRMISPVMDTYLELIERFRIAFIYGYPSAISLLAAHARKAGWSPPRTLRGVLMMSESTRPFQRAIIRQGFGPVSILAGYGLSEKVAIAGEILGRPDEYEFEPLYGVTELVDSSGSPVDRTGGQGRLVGTGFLSMGMPLIRYDTGDLATLADSPSQGNRWRLRVRNIISCYWQEFLVTREGALITPTVFELNNKVAREFQFAQHEPGVATMRIVPEQGVTRVELEPLLLSINEQADGLMFVVLDVVDEIPPTRRGKRVMVEQHLDLSQFGLADG